MLLLLYYIFIYKKVLARLARDGARLAAAIHCYFAVSADERTHAAA